jgi:hypothetical protein
MSLNEKYRKNRDFCDTFPFCLEKTAFDLDENQKQNDGKNQKKDETHAMYTFAVLGFWEYLGMIGK